MSGVNGQGGDSRGRSTHPRASRRHQRGSAAIEFSLIAMLAILVLLSSEENVVEMLFDALQKLYAAFTYALSMTYPTPD